MVYVISDGEYQKIGHSVNPIHRFQNLQTSNARELSFIYLAHGSLVDEAKLHEKYAQYHVRGEWFCLPNKVVKKLYFDASNLLMEPEIQALESVATGPSGELIATTTPVFEGS